jgi:hypothetical protein
MLCVACVPVRMCASLSTLSLVPDIGWIWDSLVGTSSNSASQALRAGRASRAGTRAGRVVRLVRLFRIVKLYKHMGGQLNSGAGKKRPLSRRTSTTSATMNDLPGGGGPAVKSLPSMQLGVVHAPMQATTPGSQPQQGPGQAGSGSSTQQPQQPLQPQPLQPQQKGAPQQPPQQPGKNIKIEEPSMVRGQRWFWGPGKDSGKGKVLGSGDGVFMCMCAFFLCVLVRGGPRVPWGDRLDPRK